MPTKTRINGQNYTQLPRLVSDDIILAGLPQTAGAPDGYGDLAEALLSRNLSAGVSVLDFGAVADIGSGDTDNTVAFQQALDAAALSGKCVIVPNAGTGYLVGALTVPDGVSMVGVGWTAVPDPSSRADLYGTCAIFLKEDATQFLTVGTGNTYEMINFVGRSARSVSLFTNASTATHQTFFRCGNFFMDSGFSKSSGIVRGLRLVSCQAYNNNKGLLNVVDSYITSCHFMANQEHGVSLSTGANDNTFVGCRIDWNNQHNVNIFQAESNVFSACILDRSGLEAARVVSSSVVFSSCAVDRSYRTATGGSHILFQDSEVAFVGCSYKSGANDDGSGLDSPDYMVNDISSSGRLSISSPAGNGYLLQPLKQAATGRVFFTGLSGYPNTPQPAIDATVSIATAGSHTVPVAGSWLRTLTTFTNRSNKVDVKLAYRNSTSGQVANQIISFRITRAGSGVAIAAAIFKQDAASTLINEAGSNLNVTIANIATDGSSFDVLLSNTTANTLQTTVWVDSSNQP